MKKGYFIVLYIALIPLWANMAYANDPNLKDYWALDESSGTTAYDLTGNYNGILHGATWTPDSRFSYGNALSFNGSAYVDIGNIGITEDWTVCFWAKSSDNSGLVYYPVGLGNSRAGIAMGGTYSSITQHIVLYDGYNVLQSLTVIDTGTWYHIAVTKSATTYSIYVNGVCETTRVLSDIDLTNFKIGCRPDSFGYFKGTIDDVGVWNSVLDAGDANDPNPGTINYVRLNGIAGPGDGKAVNPNPSMMLTNVPIDIMFHWKPGEYAADVNGHRFYLSKNFSEVNEGTIDYIPLTEPNYSPVALDYGTTYYWRVDEVNDPCIWQGRIWKFMTNFGGAIDPNLVSNWRFDKGSGSVAYDSIGNYNGVINNATWTQDGQFGNALNFLGNGRVDIGDIGIKRDWTVCFWAKSFENTGVAYYPIGLGNYSAGIAMGGTAYSITQHIVIYDGTSALKSLTKIKTGEWYHIAVTKSSTNYSIYVNGVCEKAGVLNDIDLTNFKVGSRPDSLGFFKGTIDDIGVWDCALPGGDINDPNPGTINYVRLNGVSGAGYGVAWHPFPDDKQTGVDRNVELGWRPVLNTAGVDEHRVYFSRDFESVQGESIPYISVNEPNYTPGILDINTTYYWRVDEIISSDIWMGLVWSFTTRPGEASQPYPEDDANVSKALSDVELTWTPGVLVADTNGHDVFFGTSFTDVQRGRREFVSDMDGDGKVDLVDLGIVCGQWLNYVEGMEPQADLNGDKIVDSIDLAILADEWERNLVYKGRQTDNRYDPCNIEYGVTYYWRVDEFNEPNVWPGEVWSFTAGITLPILSNASTYQITPTYDGSGQAMHPDIVYFPDSWNGYKYWMSMTPLTNSNASKENPSILGSNDGSSWEVPAGLSNPLIFAPISGGYNADPELVYNDDTNELWLYYLQFRADTNETKMGLMKSSTGITWTSPEYLITWNNKVSDNERSFSIIKQGPDWHYWAETNSPPSNIVYRHSTDGENWSSNTIITFSPPPSYLPWHLSVIYVPTLTEYWMVYSAPGGLGGNLYLAKSKDRINWNLGLSEILSPSAYGWDNYMLYRPTLLYDSTSQMIRIWYSARSTSTEWHTGYTEAQY